MQYTNNTPLFLQRVRSATGLSPVRSEQHYTKGMLGYSVESAITGMTQMALWDKDKWEKCLIVQLVIIFIVHFKQFYKMNETSRSALSGRVL